MLDRPRYHADFADDTEPGRIARALGAVTRNPARSLAAVVIVASLAAVAVNAAFFQTGEHPAPMFATRTAGDTLAPGERTALAPAPIGGADEVGRLVQLTLAEPPQVAAAPASAMVVEVQRLLTAQGYQPGVVDGLFGARTRSAIEAYQRDRNLPVNGTVNEDLLAQLRRTATDPVATAAVQTTESARILAVQTALNQTGFGPVIADGELTAATREAIRGFQLHYGLSPTGRVDQELIARMVAIGALDPL